MEEQGFVGYKLSFTILLCLVDVFEKINLLLHLSCITLKMEVQDSDFGNNLYVIV